VRPQFAATPCGGDGREDAPTSIFMTVSLLSGSLSLFSGGTLLLPGAAVMAEGVVLGLVGAAAGLSGGTEDCCCADAAEAPSLPSARTNRAADTSLLRC